MKRKLRFDGPANETKDARRRRLTTFVQAPKRDLEKLRRGDLATVLSCAGYEGWIFGLGATENIIKAIIDIKAGRDPMKVPRPKRKTKQPKSKSPTAPLPRPAHHSRKVLRLSATKLKALADRELLLWCPDGHPINLEGISADEVDILAWYVRTNRRSSIFCDIDDAEGVGILIRQNRGSVAIRAKRKIRKVKKKRRAR